MTGQSAVSQKSQNLEEVMAFIYDIPKMQDRFSNKSLGDFFVSKGYKGCTVQIIKDKKNDENSKPFWSGRIRFKNAAYLKKATQELKYFQVEGYQLRMLSYDTNLARCPQESMYSKPDNSEENCNLVVKGLNPEMTELELESYFSKFGPVGSCKIAKDETGKSKTYGFVWFQRGQDANTAMLSFKDGEMPYTLDWYKILGKRPS